MWLMYVELSILRSAFAELLGDLVFRALGSIFGLPNQLLIGGGGGVTRALLVTPRFLFMMAGC